MQEPRVVEPRGTDFLPVIGFVVAGGRLIPVVQHGGAGQGEQHGKGQDRAVRIPAQQLEQAARKAQTAAEAPGGLPAERLHQLRPRLGREQLQSELVVAAEESEPGAARRELREAGLHQDVRLLLDHRLPEQGQQREVKGRVALVALAEVFPERCRWLVGLGQEHRISPEQVQSRAEDLQHQVRFRQAFAARALLFPQHGRGIQAEALHPGDAPAGQDPAHGGGHGGLRVVEVGLEWIETMEVVLARLRRPAPVGIHQARKDVRGPRVAPVVIAPMVPGAMR